MILYENSIENFLMSSKTRSLANYIIDEYRRRASRKLSAVRKYRWKFIMEILRRLIEDADVNGECGIRIDYVMLEKHNRFEILICGVNNKGEWKVLQMGLLSGTSIESSDSEDFVVISDDENSIETLHPSLQSITYKKYLVRNNANIDIQSFAYLFEISHDRESEKILQKNKDLIDESPIFFAEEESDVVEMIGDYRDMKEGMIVLNLLHEEDHVSGKSAELFFAEMETELSGIKLSPDQKLVVATIEREVKEKNNTLLIVDGDPGTGKTMAAMYALKKLQNGDHKVGYISDSPVLIKKLRELAGNSFSREMYIERADDFIKMQEENSQEFDVLVIDEAQNLVSHDLFNGSKKAITRRFMKVFEDVPVMVVIHNSLQMISGMSVGVDVFESAARDSNKQLLYRYVSGNTRFVGKGSVVRWLSHQLQLADTENFEDWDHDSYKIELVAHPDMLKDRLKAEDGVNRILVNANSLSEFHKSDNGVYVYRLEREQFKIPMCMVKSNGLLAGDALDYAGSAYNVQGLEFDYCGVIVGPELSYNEVTGEVIVLGEKDDKKIKIVKNIYHVLLSRAKKGVYIYISDEKLRNFFEEKLYYSTRRFSWIKKLGKEYTPQSESVLLDNADKRNEDLSYVVNMYVAINHFINEIKQFSESELDEEKYKEVADKCSDFLMKIEFEDFSIEKRRQKIEDEIEKNMGTDAWKKLGDTGKKCLVSAEMTYQDMRDYNSLYDFSSVCLQASKAVEYEITVRFFDSYIDYLEENTGYRRDQKEFLDNVPDCVTRTDSEKRLRKESEVTLGSIQYIVGIDCSGTIIDETAFECFQEYAADKLLKKGLEPLKTLKRHVKYIIRVKNDYRNKAAHKNTMDVVTAKQCLDYIIDVQKTLAEMLNDYTE